MKEYLPDRQIIDSQAAILVAVVVVVVSQVPIMLYRCLKKYLSMNTG